MPVFTGDIVNGKYRVEHVLGEGGMGVVVAARHLELEELYAIKVMKREALGCDAYAERRFIGEARAAARLKGDHVARVHDIGRLDTGELYMVMEHLVGTDLKTVVHKRGPLPVQEAVTYVLQTCEALAEAHALDIIHRDIKPHNLFLTGGNSIKVLDFGISKQPPKQGPDLTGTNIILGTLLYMSPEQMAQSKTVDARSDVWSIGVVLYELVTGTVPFPGEGILEIAIRVSKGALTPPSQLRPGLPMAVDAIVERCLQKDPEQRFGSVTELAEALRSVTTSSAWGVPPSVLQLASPAVAPPVGSELAGASVSDAEATNRRERNIVAGPPLPVDLAEVSAESAPGVATRNERWRPGIAPRQNAPRLWSWAIGLGVIGAAALTLIFFNVGLISSAPASQPTAKVSPSVYVRPPGEPSREVNPSAPVQPPSEPSREANPSAPVQPPSEPSREVSPSAPVQPQSETPHEANPSAPVQPPSETSHEVGPSVPLLPSNHRSHDANSNKKRRHSSESSNNGGSSANALPVSSGEASTATSGDSIPRKEPNPTPAVSPPSGNQQDSVFGTATNSRCKALTDGHFPYLVDLSRYTSERRFQLTKNSTCYGDKAKTQLCCRAPIID